MLLPILAACDFLVNKVDIQTKANAIVIGRLVKIAPFVEKGSPRIARNRSGFPDRFTGPVPSLSLSENPTK